MSVIFGASTDLGHPRHSSRFIGPLFHWLFPSWPPERVDEAVIVVRKFAHGYEYLILCWLAWRLFRSRDRLIPGRWPVSVAWKSWALATAYASTDEFHQLFVPGREGAVRDVAIDSCGAAFGIGLIYIVGRIRRKW
jgi:VanZ family protein